MAGAHLKIHMSCKGGQSLRAGNKHAGKPNFARHCASCDSCRASRMDYKEASARTILETPHSAPFPGFSHPPGSQIRQADKVLNERPHCCSPAGLQTSSTLLRLCTHSLPSKQSSNFIFLGHSGDTV